MRKCNRIILAVSTMGLGLASTANASLVGQVDTFQDGSIDNWGGGASPVNVTDGGPAGTGDHFLQITSSGGGGPGSKLTTFNRSQWLGDYTSPVIGSISMDLEDLGSSPLSIRVAFKDGTGSGAAGYASTNAFSLPADSAWHHATFLLSGSAFTGINSPAESFSTLLTSPAEFRIISSGSPALDGDVIAASLGVDNITAVSAPVPEPATMSVLLTGAGVMLGKRRRR
jgi:hypothetical protein